MTTWRPMAGGLLAGAMLLSSPLLAAGGPDDALVGSAEDVSPILVGTLVPDGPVTTPDGQETTLTDLRAGAPAVLVFYRGHW